MTGVWTLFCDLFWPVGDGVPGASDPVTTNPADQSERALRLIRLAMAAGLVGVLALALGQTGFAAGLRLFAIGALAALMAAALGVLTGLLFGLPTSVGRVRVVTATGAAAPAADENNTDWYRDNTALERISEWLTTAIVTLLIANFRGIWALTGRVATGVTEAMGLATAGSASARAAAGGMVLGAYLLLGLLGGYLWSRRYLLRLFTDAVRDARLAQATSNKEIEGLLGIGNVMSRPASKTDGATAAAASAAATAAPPPKLPPAPVSGKSAAESTIKRAEFAAPIKPGPIADDPWHGRFGAAANDDRAELSARVTPIAGNAQLFRIDIRLALRNAAARAALGPYPFRLYLHPTFPESIRMETFDVSGTFLLAVAGYGAFTIGVQFYDGETLELDLSKLPGAPAAFRLN